MLLGIFLCNVLPYFTEYGDNYWLLTYRYSNDFEAVFIFVLPIAELGNIINGTIIPKPVLAAYKNGKYAYKNTLSFRIHNMRVAAIVNLCIPIMQLITLAIFGDGNDIEDISFGFLCYFLCNCAALSLSLMPFDNELELLKKFKAHLDFGTISPEEYNRRVADLKTDYKMYTKGRAVMPPFHKTKWICPACGLRCGGNAAVYDSLRK